MMRSRSRWNSVRNGGRGSGWRRPREVESWAAYGASTYVSGTGASGSSVAALMDPRSEASGVRESESLDRVGADVGRLNDSVAWARASEVRLRGFEADSRSASEADLS